MAFVPRNTAALQSVFVLVTLLLRATAALVPRETSATTELPTTAPPVPQITLPPLPTGFEDIPSDILACYESSASAAVINTFVKRKFDLLGASFTVNETSTRLSSTTYDRCETVADTGPYTTLCDGYARNTQTSDITTCSRVEFTSTETFNFARSTPAWLASWSSANTVPTPSCRIAEDDQPLCYRLHSAYLWQSSAIRASQTINDTSSTTTILPGYVLSAAEPDCHTLERTPSPDLATKSCRIGVASYEMHYWPSAPQPGTSFCANATRLPGGTRTISSLPNTAVISGLTLTSPSIYHFLKGVAVSTSIGATPTLYHHRLGPVYNVSSSFPADKIFTLAQPESEVWTAQPTKLGVGLSAHWEWSFTNGSYDADAMTQAPAPAVFDACRRALFDDCLNPDPDKPRTVSQAHYRQHAAVSIRDLLDQVDVNSFKDCDWQQYYDSGPWHDRLDMWIAPGEPQVATAITTANANGVEDKKTTATPIGY